MDSISPNSPHIKRLKCGLTSDEKRDANYRLHYGITLARYAAMFREQNGLCAACGQPETKHDPRTNVLKNLCVDHDHETGQVRALLCSGCNAALGHLKESPERARSLIAYMEHIKQMQVVEQLSLLDDIA